VSCANNKKLTNFLTKQQGKKEKRKERKKNGNGKDTRVKEWLICLEREPN
jgi:hypothetical protein